MSRPRTRRAAAAAAVVRTPSPPPAETSVRLGQALPDVNDSVDLAEAAALAAMPPDSTAWSPDYGPPASPEPAMDAPMPAPDVPDALYAPVASAVPVIPVVSTAPAPTPPLYAAQPTYGDPPPANVAYAHAMDTTGGYGAHPPPPRHRSPSPRRRSRSPPPRRRRERSRTPPAARRGRGRSPSPPASRAGGSRGTYRGGGGGRQRGRAMKAEIGFRLPDWIPAHIWNQYGYHPPMRVGHERSNYNWEGLGCLPPLPLDRLTTAYDWHRLGYHPPTPLSSASAHGGLPRRDGGTGSGVTTLTIM